MHLIRPPRRQGGRAKLTAGLIAPTSPSLPLTVGQATPSRLIGSCAASIVLARTLALLYALLRLLIDLLILRGRATADRDLELLVLRQELLVLRRTTPRPPWRTADRMILAALGRKLSAGALLLVQPATVLGWHRALVHRRWAAFGRRRGPGRPKLSAECRELVLQLARENPLWVTSASEASFIPTSVLGATCFVRLSDTRRGRVRGATPERRPFDFALLEDAAPGVERGRPPGEHADAFDDLVTVVADPGDGEETLAVIVSAAGA